MKHLNAIGLTVIGSVFTGVFAGYVWGLGNQAADSSLTRLVLFALPANLVAALLFYFLVRGSVAVAEGGVGLLILVAAVNLIGTLGVATSMAAVADTGAERIGAHLFSWGMSYAYGQAFHDVRAGTWLGE